MSNCYPFQSNRAAKEWRCALLALIIPASCAVLHDARAVETAAASTDSAPEQLEEVLVTAQKKEQRLQDVGISITALSSKDLENNDVKVAEDVVKLVPSLQYNAFTPGAVVFNIRGVSQNDYGDQQEPPIAVYYDDSYASSLNLSSFPVFDLARVEVLRGPQGTLFGRNATGGAIQYITNKPTRDFDGYFSATAGEFRQFNFEGAASGSLTPWLQGRIAFERSSDEGPFLNITDGQHWGGQDNYALRGQLASEFGEKGSVLLTVRYARNQHERNAGIYSWVGDYASPSTHNLGYYATPTTPSPFGTCDGCDLAGYSNYAINPHAGGDPWKIALNGPTRFDRTLRGASLRVETSAVGIDWVSVSDYMNMSKIDIEDGDGGPITSFDTDLRSQINQFTQEVRASATSGIHEWMVGGFFMRVNGHYTTVADFASFGDYITNDIYSQFTTSVAGFAQDEIHLADAWSLIVGGRYWRDRRKFDIEILDNFGSDFRFSPAGFPGLADRTFKGYSAKLELDRKFSDGTLVYASWNRGTKSGGFTAQFTPPADPSPAGIAAYTSGLTYDPEVLSAFEVGVKTKLLNDALVLNADAFYYDYKDYQAYVLYGPSTTIKNLNAKEHGVEVELTARPIRPLTISVGLSAMHSKVSDVILPDGTSAERTLPQAPNFSGHASIRYEVPVGDVGNVGLQWLTTYSGASCFTVFCAPIDNEGSHAVSEARISYQPTGGAWEVAALARNVTNKVYRVFDSDTNFIGAAESIYAPPRWFAITANMHFGAGKH